MNIIDLTDVYIKKVLEEQDSEAYFSADQELFEHYFAFWAPREHWHNEIKTKEGVTQHKNLIINQFGYIKECLKNIGDITEIPVVLMVGQGTTNGHAYQHGNRFGIFLPVESYQTEMQARVFVTHEFVHALHYQKQPEFYFSTIAEKESLERQLITEGLAAYISQMVLNISDADALWADYISEKEKSTWTQQCKNRLSELNELLRESALRPTVPELFMSKDPSDIKKYRGGYYLGLQLIKDLGKSPSDLLSIPRAEFLQIINKQVRETAI